MTTGGWGEGVQLRLERRVPGQDPPGHGPLSVGHPGRSLRTQSFSGKARTPRRSRPSRLGRRPLLSRTSFPGTPSLARAGGFSICRPSRRAGVLSPPAPSICPRSRGSAGAGPGRGRGRGRGGPAAAEAAEAAGEKLSRPEREQRRSGSRGSRQSRQSRQSQSRSCGGVDPAGAGLGQQRRSGPSRPGCGSGPGHGAAGGGRGRALRFGLAAGCVSGRDAGCAPRVRPPGRRRRCAGR